MALRMKPIFEARAKAQQLSTLVQNATVSPNSGERTIDIFTPEPAPVAVPETAKSAIRRIATPTLL